MYNIEVKNTTLIRRQYSKQIFFRFQIETIVNPFKTGMRTIINMPDTLVGGIAKILLGKGPLKEPSFLDVTPIHLEVS